jgi:hypothetical protein
MILGGRGIGAAIHSLWAHLVRCTFGSCRADGIEGHSS